jgi:hypothetical protein
VTDPSTTVLIMRLDELADDVTMVQGVLERLQRRGSHLDKLNKLISPTSGDETIARALSSAARQALVLENAAKNDADLAAIVKNYEVDTAQLVGAVEQAQTCLRDIGKILRAMTLVDLQQQVRNTLIENLQVCDTVLGRIKALKRELVGGTAPREIWSGLKQLHQENCRGLFADYVDLLSGMVLRDTHLDGEVCAITDDFLAELASPWLVLPGRRSELPTVFKDLIKIGFPEWTIWDVPLAAHHTGAWKAGQALPELRELLPDRSDEVRRCLFADVYATWAAGPAYACAMLLLHLDPASASGPEPHAVTDHERARVIARSLPFSEPPDEFTVFVKRIGTDWDDAVKQNTDPAAAPADTAPLDDFAQAVRELLESKPGLLYDAETWRQAKERLAPLLERGRVETEHDAADGEQSPEAIGDLLNAAWALRRDGTSAATLEGGVMSLWADGRRDGPSSSRYRGGTSSPTTYRSTRGRG